MKLISVAKAEAAGMADQYRKVAVSEEMFFRVKDEDYRKIKQPDHIPAVGKKVKPAPAPCPACGAPLSGPCRQSCRACGYAAGCND
jgi:hypothetical protein